MDVFENFENQLKANPKTIVFTEGTDARILSAASKLLAGKILNVLLLGQRKAVYDSRTAVIGDGGSGISSMDRRKPAGA